MIFNHLLWTPLDNDATGLGQIWAMGTGFAWNKKSDLPDSNKVDFTTAVEITALEFPPRVAVRRHLG